MDVNYTEAEIPLKTQVVTVNTEDEELFLTAVLMKDRWIDVKHFVKTYGENHENDLSDKDAEDYLDQLTEKGAVYRYTLNGTKWYKHSDKWAKEQEALIAYG